MATNKDLIKQAEELAGATGETITTEGLNNAQLTALVKTLKAEAEKAEAGETKEVILQCRFGEKGPGDKVSLPVEQADKLVKSKWATLPVKKGK